MPDRMRLRGGLLAFAGNRVVAIMLALSTAALLVAILAAVSSLREVYANTDRVEHTLRVEASINRLAALNEQIETARRGQLLSPAASFPRILQRTQERFDSELERLDALIADSESQGGRAAEIRALGDEREGLLRFAILTPATAASAARQGDFEQDRGVRIARRIRSLAAQMAAYEDHLLVTRNLAQARATSRAYLVGGLAMALLVTFLGTAIVLVLRYNRDLSRAQLSLREANERLESAVAARTAELTRANAEIQRFAYIVSHDLRSPLVNVLGFTAELEQARGAIHSFLATVFERHPAMRDEKVWLAVDEDLPEALGFIRKSTEKMDRLIGSILELSRQGRRPLTPETLDMNGLADGVVSSLHQLAESAGAEVTVQPLPALESDRVAVEQILSNLVENALKYLSPARAGRIAVTGRTAGRFVEIAVEDNGRGIAPADHERVFDLFRRAGTQDRPGEGIGLANVRALAYRLGGTIRLESTLGEGSVFTLSLPKTFSAVEPNA